MVFAPSPCKSSNVCVICRGAADAAVAGGGQEREKREDRERGEEKSAWRPGSLKFAFVFQ